MLGRRPCGQLIPRRLLVGLVRFSGQVTAACASYGTLLSGMYKSVDSNAERKAEEKKPLLVPALDGLDEEGR